MINGKRIAKHAILLMSMSDDSAKLKKLRTFYDDVNRLQESSPTIDVSAKIENLPDTQLPNEEITGAPAIPKIAVPKFKPKPSSEITEIPADIVKETKKTLPPTLPEIDVSLVKREDKNSLLSGHGAIFSTIEEGNETETGNIITDQKRARFKLFPAIGAALMDWFGKKQKQIQKQFETKEIGPKISDVTNRADVVKQAAERSNLAPSDDYGQITKRIKRVPKQNQASNALVIKKATEVPAPSWTYLDDMPDSKEAITEDNLINEEVTPVTEKAVPTKTFSEPEPVVETPPLPTVENVPEPKPVVSVEELPAVEVAEPTTEPVPEIEQTADTNTDLSWFTSKTETPPQNIPVESETETPTSTKTYVAANPKTAFPLWRIVAIAVLAITLGTSLTLWIFGEEENTLVINNQNQFTSLINSNEQIPIVLGSDTKTLLKNIQAVEARPTSIVVVAYPTVNISGITQPASAADILNTLAWKASGNFLRNITDINFGLYRNKDPFIIIKVASFDSAFGGILDWENNMSADLSPLFGTPVSGTFDPQARTATQIRNPYFVDVVVNNIDSRLLTDEAQKERLIYAFSDRNTIIITTNKSTLGDLLNLRR